MEEKNEKQHSPIQKQTVIYEVNHGYLNGLVSHNILLNIYRFSTLMFRISNLFFIKADITPDRR